MVVLSILTTFFIFFIFFRGWEDGIISLGHSLCSFIDSYLHVLEPVLILFNVPKGNRAPYLKMLRGPRICKSVPEQDQCQMLQKTGNGKLRNFTTA